MKLEWEGFSKTHAWISAWNRAPQESLSRSWIQILKYENKCQVSVCGGGGALVLLSKESFMQRLSTLLKKYKEESFLMGTRVELLN